MNIILFIYFTGISPNSVNGLYSTTPLHTVLEYIKTPSLLQSYMDLLIAYGANINICTLQGNLFSYALFCKNLEGAKQLIKYGIELNNPNKSNFLTMAIREGNLELVNLLFLAGFNPKLWKMNLKDYKFEGSSNNELFQFIKERMANPYTLKEICRIKIRERLKKKNENIFLAVKKMNLPAVLRRYLTFDDL